MYHEQICGWFGLEAGDWPPDHYRLLGLPQGTDDAALIEQRVQQKLDEVRRYQCMHPVSATEAMNRLAQALVCLTDPAQKRAYDEGLSHAKPRPRVMPPPVPRIAPKTPLPALRQAPLTPVPPPLPEPHAWLFTPGKPAPGEAAPAVAVLPEVIVEEPDPPAPPQPAAPPRDLVAESARTSSVATRGLSTRRALYARIAHTRRLMHVWEQLGEFLKDDEAKLTRPQAAEAFKLVEQAEEAMIDFPLLGEAGQPGYLIITLAHLDKSKALMNLSQRERESLARDWAAGQSFLDAHRDYLREEARKLRKRGFFLTMARAARGLIRDQPWAVTAILAGLAAICIAVIRAVS